MQFADHVLGQGEMLCGTLRGDLGIASYDRRGECRMLVQRPAPDFRGVRLGVEAETDFTPALPAQFRESPVVCRLRDCLVQRVISPPGLVAIDGVRVVPDG